MTDYTKTVDFAAKDALLTGNPSKLVKGTEIDTEFNNIATAVATKLETNDALGTPTSGTLTNCTGLPISTGVSGLASNVSTFLATPSSANLASAITDETGSGSLVFATSPTLVTPALGTPSALVGTNITGTASGLTAGGNALLAGSDSQVFSVGTATSAAHATRWDTPDMASLTVTQAGGALTFAGIAHPLTFRSATLTDGSVSTIIADPADLVLPSGGTLGFTTTVQGRIVVVEMNNSGTSEYAICNIAGGLQLDETNLISTTAIDTGSDLSNVWYSTTARSNLPYKIVGVVDVVNTAGAWGNPVLVQAAGGNAITSMNSIGYGQTWQILTGSRALNTTYYNTTGKPIVVNVVTSASAAVYGTLTINGVAVYGSYADTGGSASVGQYVVPPGASYIASNVTQTLAAWIELR